MGLLLTNHISLTLLLLLLCALFLIAHSAKPSTDYTNLVYKGCAAQKFQDPTSSYAQNLNALLASLLSQASQASFFSTTSGDGATAVSGLFQCRGDLTTAQCADCVAKTPDLARKLCGGSASIAAAARVQLSGCYMKYEVSGFKEAADTAVLYKVCGKRKGVSTEKREVALGMVESGVARGNGGGGGFYAGEYENVYVMGQCEGDVVESGGCGECVKSAVESLKAECGDAISGQLYLNKCYVSYSYYPNGVPSLAAPTSATTSSGTEGTGAGHGAQKTVAVVVGGVAAAGFGVVCLLFARSVLKKRHSKYDGY